MKNMGKANVILGVKIKRTQDDYTLNQSHYIYKIFKKFDSFDVDPISTLCDASMHLVKNKGVPLC